MALVSIDPVRDGRGGEIKPGATTYSKQFVLVTDNYNDDEAVVMGYCVSHFGDVGHTHPNDPNNYCVSIKVADFGDDTNKIWKITLDYTNVQTEITQLNPLEQPPIPFWTLKEVERVVDFDINGDPILNSAGDPFDPPVTVIDFNPCLNVTRNEPIFTGTLALNYNNRINSGTFYGWAAGHAKMAVTSTPAYFPNGTPYAVVTYVIEFSVEGWKKRILDAGYREKDGTDRKPIVDAFGERVTSPVPLDGSGGAADPGDPATPLEFDVYFSANFSALGL